MSSTEALSLEYPVIVLGIITPSSMVKFVRQAYSRSVCSKDQMSMPNDLAQSTDISDCYVNFLAELQSSTDWKLAGRVRYHPPA